MTKTLKLFAVSLAFILMSALSFGQTAVTQTTLASAVTTTSTTSFSVASATGITAANTVLYVLDGTSYNGEAVFVNSVNGTTIGVTRGYNGTKSSKHISGAIVFAGPPPAFHQVDPSGEAIVVKGTASCTNEPYTPYINYLSGHVWLCSTITNSWVPGFFNTAAVPGVTTAVASAAGQVLPSGPLFHITGTAAITGFTSATGMGGLATSTIGAPFCVIPDGAFTTTATNNIAKASTAVVDRPLCFTFDQTQKLYMPSY